MQVAQIKVENQDTALEDEEELDSDLENLVSIEDLDEDLIAEEGGINIEDDEDSENLSGIADLDVHNKNEENDNQLVIIRGRSSAGRAHGWQS